MSRETGTISTEEASESLDTGALSVNVLAISKA